MEAGTKAKSGEHPVGDVGQIVCLVVFLVIWAVDSFFAKITTFPAAYVPLAVRLVVLALAFGIAMYLYRSGHFITSHESRPQGVVANGVFRYVRHPVYLASILTYLGLAVSTLSVAALGLFVAIFLFYDYIATYEERLLEAKYGDEYRDYKARTGKWIPCFGAESAGH
jgi:protein-S-isoprenylcysteine O-methyltransferase Ste14